MFSGTEHDGSRKDGANKRLWSLGEGFNYDRDADRAYLRATHRHLFSIEVQTRVDHDERDIEFHDLRDEAAAIFRGLSVSKQDFGSQSCETLARRLATQLADHYARTMTVIVSEDGECGASVEVGPEVHS